MPTLLYKLIILNLFTKKNRWISLTAAQIARPRCPNVGPPVAPPLGHRWQLPVGQRHFGQWANVGPTVACGMPVWPPVGHRWANISATVGPMINSDKCSTVFKTLFTNSSQTQTKSSPNHNRCRCHCRCALVLASSITAIENRHSAFCTHHFVGHILYK